MNKLQQLSGILEQQLGQPWLGVRQDIAIQEAAFDEWKRPQWVLKDRLSGNFFTVGAEEKALFQCLANHKRLYAALEEYLLRYGKSFAPQDLFNFLRALLDERLAIVQQAALGSQQESLLQRYRQLLFYRKPLLTPNRLLDNLLPYTRWLASTAMIALMVLLGLFGLANTLPQFELYLSTADYLLTAQGGALFIVVVAVTKICHEFSHALVARAHGLSVARMGILFMVLWPVLYTDVTDAWRAPRRTRLKIAGAGILFELGLAAIALWLWSVSYDGLFRSLCFFVSGASLLTTVFINLNPLMRFDGYYLLMDYLNIPNLQERSGALLRHKLRTILWGWSERVPEAHPRSRFMLLYALAVAIYRLVLGIGISLAVYSFIGAELGLLLLLLTLFALVVQPWGKELIFVMKNKDRYLKKSRAAITLLAVLAAVALMFVPYQQTSFHPAFVVSANFNEVVALADGRLQAELPQKGQVLESSAAQVTLADPALQSELEQAKLQLQAIDASIANRALGGESDAIRRTLLSERERQLATIETIRQAQRQLVMRVDGGGRVILRQDQLRVGADVVKGTWLFSTADPERRELKVYLNESAIPYLAEARQSSWTVISELEELDGIEFKLAASEPVATRQFINPTHYDTTGGNVATQDADGERQTIESYYQLTAPLPDLPSYIPHGLPVQVSLLGEHSSVMQRIVAGLSRWLAAEGVI